MRVTSEWQQFSPLFFLLRVHVLTFCGVTAYKIKFNYTHRGIRNYAQRIKVSASNMYYSEVSVNVYLHDGINFDHSVYTSLKMLRIFPRVI